MGPSTWSIDFSIMDRLIDGLIDQLIRSSYLVLIFAVVSFRCHCLLHDVSAAHCRLFRFWTCFLPSSWTTSTTWRVTGPSLDRIISTSSFVNGLSTTLMPRTHYTQLSSLMTCFSLLQLLPLLLVYLSWQVNIDKDGVTKLDPWANWNMDPFQFLVWALSH